MISLGSIDFNTDIADGDGILWYVTIDGWDKLAQRTSDVAFTTRHGGRITSNLYEPRQMTLQGVAAASDDAGYWVAKNKINSVTNVLTGFSTTPLLLVVPEEVDKQMSVLRTSLFTSCVDSNVMTFELTLRADDPFKYSVETHDIFTGGSAVNVGTAPSYLTFTLAADGQPTLSADSQTWFASASLPSGTVIDMKAQTVRLDTSDQFGSTDLASDWLFLPAQSTTTLNSDVAGDFTWKDAWL